MRIAAALGMLTEVFSDEERREAVIFLCQADKGIPLLRCDGYKFHFNC